MNMFYIPTASRTDSPHGKRFLPSQSVREAFSQMNISSSMKAFHGRQRIMNLKNKLLGEQLTNSDNNNSIKIKGL